MKKYELLKDETKKLSDGTIVYRIRALRDFGDVKAGQIGGWIESEYNLSHEGDCWVYDDAQVRGTAQVSGDAWVFGDARVFDSARVRGDAWVSGKAQVCGRRHLIVIDSIGSEDGVLSAFRQSDGSIGVNRGCFTGTIEEFEEAVKKTHGDNIHAQIYRALIPVIKMRLTQVA